MNYSSWMTPENEEIEYTETGLMDRFMNSLPIYEKDPLDDDLEIKEE